VRPLRIAALLICVALFSSCAKRETPVEEGIRTKTLIVGNGSEPADLDPHVVYTATDQRVQVALFEGLAAFDEKSGLPVPGAAERWESSPDGLTWTFHLRAGLSWSNGDPLTADDFVQSWRRALTPAVACPNAYLFSPVKNADAFNAGKITDPAALGFAAPDARTVTVTTEFPTAILPLFAALPCWAPVNLKVLARFDAAAKRGPAWTRPGNLVGNGPFVLAEWSPNARIVVAKNPRYWDAARNGLERVVILPTENPEAEEVNFRAGQVHVTFAVPHSKIAGYRERAPDRLRVDPALDCSYLNFNCGKAPLDQAKVRRALSLAMDREAISRAVYFGSATAAFHLVPNPTGNFIPRSRLVFDPEAARRLVAEAGFPGGRGLPRLSLLVGTDSTAKRVAEVLQAGWKTTLGLDVAIDPAEEKILTENQRSGSYSIALWGWIADFADPMSFLAPFATGNGNNVNFWSHPEFDRALADAARTTDLARRAELFQQAEALLLAESPLAPVVFKSKAYLIHPAVKNWQPAPLLLQRFQLIRLEK